MVMDYKGYRNELKYLLTKEDLFFLEERVKTICTLDSHVDKCGGYLIRSLYFDFSDDKCYMDTVNGVDRRKKYRIRTYNCSGNHISFEIKEGLYGKKRKDINVISMDLYNEIISHKTIQYSDEYIELCNKIPLELLSPRVIVEYTRKPYIYDIGNVRITFDNEIKAIIPEDLFGNFSGGISILPEELGLLEVKYDDYFPSGLKCAFDGFDMKRTSFSKYVRCFEALKGID